MTLFNGNPVDLDVFNEGLQACIDFETQRSKEKQVNPYQPNTDKWYSWFKGWNSYDYENYVVNLGLNLPGQPIETTDIPKPDEIGQIEKKPIRVITDFKMFEVSLMHDGKFQPGGYIN